MGLLPPDFESGAYTNFATQARTKNIKSLDRIVNLSRKNNFEPVIADAPLFRQQVLKADP